MTSDRSRRHQGKPSAAERITLSRRDEPGGAAWEIVQPRCARRRREDIEEVEAMIAGGEPEIAREELVWLLSECPDFLEAHVHLGMIALEEGDAKLARGHFGRAYELCLRVIEAAGNPKPLPHALPGNRPFYEAAKGLVHCLLETGRRKIAADACRRIAPLDPADPLGIQKLLKR
jgi:tetratricopeptide (TPR) repeat protein